MSTTTQLEHWAMGHGPLYKNATFIGVYPSDRLPDPQDVATSAPVALIVNYDPTDLPGSHWCAILITWRVVWWFDSYGLPPDAPDLLLGHETHFRCWLTAVCRFLGLAYFNSNQADLQSLGESTCGHWAVFFLANGPKNGWAPFGPNPEANDALIRRLVGFT